jgi:hypothetical protein
MEGSRRAKHADFSEFAGLFPFDFWEGEPIMNATVIDPN